jgi:hypothetical protein
MKDIAQNKYADIGRFKLISILFAFTLTISSLGVNAILALDDYWEKVIKGDHSHEALFTSSIVSIFWALCVIVFGFFFEKVLLWNISRDFPCYFFYTFKSKDNQDHDDSIVGWFKIDLDTSNRSLHVIGESYSAHQECDISTCVKWESKSVNSGESEGRNNCSFIYNLNLQQAQDQGRSYRQGLLLFRPLQEHDFNGDEWIEPLFDHEQYIGHQQGVDRGNIWNSAYAERIFPQGSNNKEKRRDLMMKINRHYKTMIEVHNKLKQ